MCSAARVRVESLLILFLCGIADTALAQRPVITNAPRSVSAGVDFATDVLSDPWDFSNEADLGPFPDELGGWTASGDARVHGRRVFLRDGYFVARTTRPGGNLIPLLFRGGRDFITSATERTGKADHQAIPTARYGKLAVAMTLSGTTQGEVAAFWYTSPYGTRGEGARGVGFGIPQAGTHIYIVDLVTGLWTDQRGNPAPPGLFRIPPFDETPWNAAGVMRGFQLRATSDGNAEVDVRIDWVRLTQRDGQLGASLLPIGFNGCPARDYTIEVQIENQWEIIHSGIAGGDETVAHVNYGVLPPGSWDFRVVCFAVSRLPEGGVGVASDAVTILIDGPPLVTVHTPDARGGADFATEELGNPWDMNAVTDVADHANITAPTVVWDGLSNVFEARATNGDPIVEFLNGAATIDTRRYRHLTFSLALDTPFGLDGRAGHGSVARVLWGPETNPRTTSQDIIVWPGRNDYSVDLSALTAANGGIEDECIPQCPHVPWTQDTVRFFRIDPHESTLGVTFRLGPVTLAAPDEVSLGASYNVEYSFADAQIEGSAFEARFYLDRDRDPESRSLVDTVTVAVRPDTLLRYAFNPASKGVEPGEYYLYVEIVETNSAGYSQSRGLYSTGSLVVGGMSPPLPNAPRNLSVTAVGNDVALSWQPPDGGGPLTGYRIEVSSDATFATSSSVVVSDRQLTAAATYPNGIWFFRVVSVGAAGIPGGVSNIASITLSTDGRRRGHVRRPPPPHQRPKRGVRSRMTNGRIAKYADFLALSAS